MQVLIGDPEFLKQRLQTEDLTAGGHWQVASAEAPLPVASVYVDLSGCFSQYRPPTCPPEAWWVVHAPAQTLKELPPNTIRLNAWPGFVEGKVWEMTWEGERAEQISEDVCGSLGKNAVNIPDQIGFVGARVLASVINEAFMLLGEGAADRNNIDQAMKLGTNYPYGPFEWAERIGHKEIHNLLIRLSENDSHYSPAPAWKELNLE